jgi:flagellar biosynthetic protein FlhB
VSGEKTEKPTEKRRREARREGRVPRTPDFGAWLGILVASFLIPQTGAHAVEQVQTLLVRATTLVGQPDEARAQALFASALRTAASLVLPLALTMVAVAVVSSVAQGGMTFATKKLKPDFSHLNPGPGLKRMFGPQSGWEAVKSVLKVGVLALVLWHATATVRPLVAAGNQLPLASVLGTVGTTVLAASREAAAVGLAIAAMDYAVVRQRMMKSMRMSKQDIKDEHKTAEGDPHVKGQIKSRQMQMARNRMMADVKDADVVIVNPTHVAVALAYDPAKGAPRVLAKGADHVATRIRELAEEHRIPMVVDIPLARTMYRSVELGAEIPPELYNAVARVLAFVLSLRSRGSVAGVHNLPGAGRR